MFLTLPSDRRQCGQVDRALDLKSGGRGLKSALITYLFFKFYIPVFIFFFNLTAELELFLCRP